MQRPLKKSGFSCNCFRALRYFCYIFIWSPVSEVQCIILLINQPVHYFNDLVSQCKKTVNLCSLKVSNLQPFCNVSLLRYILQSQLIEDLHSCNGVSAYMFQLLYEEEYRQRNNLCWIGTILFFLWLLCSGSTGDSLIHTADAYNHSAWVYFII